MEKSSTAPCSVPHAAVVRGRHAEAVRARREVRVVNLTLVEQLPPTLILPSSFTRKRAFSGRHQAQRREVEQQVAHTRWKSQTLRGVVGLAVGCDMLDVDRRGEFVDNDMTRIDDLDAFSQEPEFAVGGLCDGGL
jgi:hypothetical protein